ncbi:MAG TPA: hypothetical protein VN611_12400 [Patescibacteria group bacterium]|nr:hypothetical protein [Patescibacteria group bacterium]
MHKQFENWIFLTGILLLLCSWSGSAAAAGTDHNPIDAVFSGRITDAMSTPERNYVAEKYLAAWKAELDNVADGLKNLYHFDADKARVDEYTTACTQAADAAYKLEWLNWADRDAQPPQRKFGTGASGAAMLMKAKVYRQATLNLVGIYQGQAGRWQGDANSEYLFIYSGDGGKLPR